MRAVLTAIPLLAALPAFAQQGPVHAGDWLVGPLDVTSCQAEAHFGDHYLLNISEDSSGAGHFLFSDDRLVLKDGDTKPATYSWDGWKTVKPGSFSAVRTAAGKTILVMETDSGFTESMSGARALSLRIPGLDFDDEFAIPNTTEITLALVTCNANH
jgi:hypothetical protein